MEDKVLVEQPIGEVGKVELDLKDGKLVLSSSVAKADLGLEAKLEMSADLVLVAELLLGKVKEKIPGQIDDAVIDLVLGAVKMLKA